MFQPHSSFTICRRYKQSRGSGTLADNGSSSSVSTGTVIAGTTTTSGRVDFKSTPSNVNSLFHFRKPLLHTLPRIGTKER